MYQFIVSPLVHYAMLAAGLGLCLYLFYSLKTELHAVRKSAPAGDSRADLETRVSELRERLETALADAWTPQQRPVAINFTKRTQALRMSRRGESAATIAGALALPRNQIELLLKVQKLIRQR